MRWNNPAATRLSIAWRTDRHELVKLVAFCFSAVRCSRHISAAIVIGGLGTDSVELFVRYLIGFPRDIRERWENVLEDTELIHSDGANRVRLNAVSHRLTRGCHFRRYASTMHDRLNGDPSSAAALAYHFRWRS